MTGCSSDISGQPSICGAAAAKRPTAHLGGYMRVIQVAHDEARAALYYISMPEIPKLTPEVELPRPRSSGVAVVAVAALAMFTAVGASAFIVRVRMGMSPCTAFERVAPRVPGTVDREGRVELERVGLISAFVAAVADHDDRTALVLYQQIPSELDPTFRLMRMRDAVVARQMALLDDELSRGACDELRRHIGWLRQAAPDESLQSIHVGECADARPRYITVELAP